MPLRSLTALSLALLGTSPIAHAQEYERIDVNDLAQPASPTAHIEADLSQDGRFVVFTSIANNLGGLTSPTTEDVFLRDRLTGTTTAITSTAVAGGVNLVALAPPRISGDGAVVVFMRGQDNLIFPFRPYRYDRASGMTTEIVVPGLVKVRVTALDFTGTYAVLSALAISNPVEQVYRLQLVTGELVLCSRDPAGNPVGGGEGDIDANGTHVAFSSDSPLIVPGDTNGKRDVFVLDIPGNVMLRASVGANGTQGNGTSVGPSISEDGRFVALSSLATNLVIGDTNGRADAFVRDLRLETTEIRSLDTTQAQLANGSKGGANYLSGDASSLAFSSSELIGAGDTSSFDTYLSDVVAGVLLPVTLGSPVRIDFSEPQGITRDGREVLVTMPVVHSTATTGAQFGLYAAKFGPRCASSGYCTSLPNSTGKAASIGAQGDASRELNNLVIAGLGLPDTAIALLVSGTSAVDPGMPFGNGLLCVGGGLIRHGVQVANGGVILDAQDMHAAEYAAVHPGDTRYYQIVYRDPPAGGALFNTTDAVAITFCW